VIDPKRRVVFVWNFDLGATEPTVESERVLWQPEPGRPALELDVAALFMVP
jgi:hypothetical protein